MNTTWNDDFVLSEACFRAEITGRTLSYVDIDYLEKQALNEALNDFPIDKKVFRTNVAWLAFLRAIQYNHLANGLLPVERRAQVAQRQLAASPTGRVAVFDEDGMIFQEQTNEKLRVLDTKLDTVMQQLAVLVGAGTGRNDDGPPTAMMTVDAVSREVGAGPNYIIANPSARKGPRTDGV
jgi:hypothetical protein